MIKFPTELLELHKNWLLLDNFTKNKLKGKRCTFNNKICNFTDFSNISIPSAKAYSSSFLGCDFSNSNFTSFVCIKSTFKKSIFLETNLLDSDFRDCIFDDSDMRNVNLNVTHAIQCSFNNCNLNGAFFGKNAD